MSTNPRQRRVVLFSFLTIGFLGALVFSDYLELCEVDCFSSNLTCENLDLPTLTNLEKIKPNQSPANVRVLPPVSFLDPIISFRVSTSCNAKMNGCFRC